MWSSHTQLLFCSCGSGMLNLVSGDERDVGVSFCGTAE